MGQTPGGREPGEAHAGWHECLRFASQALAATHSDNRQNESNAWGIVAEDRGEGVVVHAIPVRGNRLGSAAARSAVSCNLLLGESHHLTLVLKRHCNTTSVEPVFDELIVGATFRELLPDRQGRIVERIVRPAWEKVPLFGQAARVKIGREMHDEV